MISENVLGVQHVVPLLAYPIGTNLRRISGPQLVSQLCQQSLEPQTVSPGFHAYSNHLPG